VLEVGQVITAPFCTLVLADLGAEVIKVERPGQGDLARELRPYVTDEQGRKISARFVGLNRGKKSICINLETTRGQQLLREIVAHSDVLVENQRPGRMKEWGLDYEDLREVNPRLIYASITGFGHPRFGASPMADKPAFDLTPLALSGFMDMNGEPDRPPQRPGGIPLGDYLPAIFSAAGVVAALFRREKTGTGSFIDCCMYESVLAILERPVAMYLVEGVVERRNGGRVPQPYGVFEAKDGYVAIGALGSVMWKRLCSAIGKQEWIEDLRFQTQEQRYRYYYDAIEPELVTWCKQRTVAEVISILEGHGIPVAKVRTVAEAMECPHVRERKVLREVPVSSASRKTVKVLRGPLLISGEEDKPIGPAPLLGEHTAEVLRAILGYGDQEISALLRDGVIASGP
jgi:CoA:oxalate CoA-transferase